MVIVSVQGGALGDWHLVARSQHERACPHVRRCEFWTDTGDLE